MEEKILTGKKNGMAALFGIILLYILALAAGSARVDFVRQICGHFERGRILLRESFLYQCESGS